MPISANHDYNFAILHNNSIYWYGVEYGCAVYNEKDLIRRIEAYSLKGKGILVYRVNPVDLFIHHRHVVRFSVTDGMIFEVLDWDVFKREWTEWLKALEESKVKKDKLPYAYPRV